MGRASGDRKLPSGDLLTGSNPIQFLILVFSPSSSSSSSSLLLHPPTLEHIAPCLPLVDPSTFSRSAPSRLRPARYVLFFVVSPDSRSNCSCSAQASKVAVLGAAGGIGQPLSLLMKLNPRVSELALYDIRGGPGMFASSSSFRLHPNRLVFQVSRPI